LEASIFGESDEELSDIGEDNAAQLLEKEEEQEGESKFQCIEISICYCSIIRVECKTPKKNERRKTQVEAGRTVR
jgi:hypothetical protein